MRGCKAASAWRGRRRRPRARGRIWTARFRPQAAGERGPDGRKLSAKQRLSKRGKPGAEEPPKAEEPLTNEPPKSEAAAKEEGKPEEAKPAGETPSQSAKVEPPRESGGETSTLRSDPVPPVTPAPPATTPPAVSAASVSGGSEPAAASTVSSPPVGDSGLGAAVASRRPSRTAGAADFPIELSSARVPPAARVERFLESAPRPRWHRSRC